MTDRSPPQIPTIDEILAAAQRIDATTTRTPLVHLEGTSQPEIWLKLETLQPINSFKNRGATAAITALSSGERSNGVWTVSAGNAGQGVAYAAYAGVSATVLVIESAPETKIERMRRLGARIVKAPFDDCWAVFEERDYPGTDGTFIHPFDDHEFIAGNATIGLEILENLPETQLMAAAVGGGGLSTGIGAAVHAPSREFDSDTGRRDPAARQVVGVEPETAAPAARSYEQGKPQSFPEWEASFVDGAGGKSLLPRMWERMQQVVDDVVVVSLDEVKDAMRVLAKRPRIISEGVGALPVAAALSGKLDAEDPVVDVVSGGNIDLETFHQLIHSSGPDK